MAKLRRGKRDNLGVVLDINRARPIYILDCKAIDDTHHAHPTAEASSHRQKDVEEERTVPLIMNRRTLIISTGALAATAASPLLAGGHSATVEMLNANPDDRSQRMVFLPRVLAVAPGDTVLWAPANPGHNSASIDGMIPDGADGWNGQINQEVTVTFEAPGVYGYQCTPHASVGMFGLVVVQAEDGSAPANLEAAQSVRQRGRASQVWDAIWAEAGEMGLLG